MSVTLTPQPSPATAPAPSAMPAPKQPDMGESAASDQAQAEATPAAGVDSALSPKLAALARREKAIREKAREIEAKDAALTAQLEAMKTKVSASETWQTRIKEDPYGTLLEMGMTADQVAGLLLNQPDPQSQAVKQLEAKIAKLEGELNRGKEDTQKQQQTAYEQAKSQIRNDVSLLVDGDESFEAIKAYGSQALDAVVDLIERTYQEKKYVMDLDTAAREVEDYLTEQATGFAKLKKVQSKLAPPASEPKQPASPKQPQSTQPLTTLSNKIAPQTTRNLTAEERRARAIAVMEGRPVS